MSTPSSSIPLVAPETRSRFARIWERLGFSVSNNSPSSTPSPVTTGVYVEELVADYKRRAADLGVPPEVLAADKIFTYHKNVVEFCRAWHQGKLIRQAAVHDTIALLRLNVAVLEALTEERRA